jgi:hypothetical protein
MIEQWIPYPRIAADSLPAVIFEYGGANEDAFVANIGYLR